MGILILLVPLAILMSAGGVAAWYWACFRNQFDDLESPPYEILFEDEPTQNEEPKR